MRVIIGYGLVLLSLALLVPGCMRHAQVPPPAAPSSSASPTEERRQEIAPEEPGPGTLLADAMRALDEGRLGDAERHLDGAIGEGARAEDRSAARYLLALLLARPDYEKRDVAHARVLLEEMLDASPPAAQETGARLVLSLLDLEADYQRIVADLRIRAASAGAEADDLRGILSQREAELRRIKEILLGRAGGS